MAAKQNRHHASHPPSTVKPNLAVNQKPKYTPPLETASINTNPSLPGPVGVDAVNARVNNLDLGDDCNPDKDDCEDGEDEDRTNIPFHN